MAVTYGPYYASSVADVGTGWSPDDATRLLTNNGVGIDWDTTEPSPVILKIYSFGAGVATGMRVIQADVNAVLAFGKLGPTLECAVSLDSSTTPITAWQTLNSGLTSITFACSAEAANNSNFTLLVRPPAAEAMTDARSIDQLSVTFYAISGGDTDMDYFASGKAGGYKPLLTEAIPSISSSASIFANAPEGTVMVEIDIRTQGIYFKFDGGTASSTAGSGMLYAAGTVYRLPLNTTRAAAVKAIQAGATSTGTITYWGVEK